MDKVVSRSETELDIRMATKTLEARFEHLSVTDENEPTQNAPTTLKSKVLTIAGPFVVMI